MAVLGMTALALVLVDVGSLYRERYVYGMLVLLLAIDGAFRIGRALHARKESRQKEPGEPVGSSSPPPSGRAAR
jgi:hypothetical protein